jgi:hypothetical protein
VDPVAKGVLGGAPVLPSFRLPVVGVLGWLRLRAPGPVAILASFTLTDLLAVRAMSVLIAVGI